MSQHQARVATASRERKRDLLAGMNDAQVDSVSRIGQDHGETAVGIADGQVTHGRSITAAGDAHSVPLQMPGKVAQGVALATLQYAAVVVESDQAATGIRSDVGPAFGIEHQVPGNGAAAPVLQRIGEDASPFGPIPGVVGIVDEGAAFGPMEGDVRRFHGSKLI